MRNQIEHAYGAPTMSHRIPMNDGDEYDALSKWKRLFRWRPGKRKAVKKKYNKRFRKEVKRIAMEDFNNDPQD